MKEANKFLAISLIFLLVTACIWLLGDLAEKNKQIENLENKVVKLKQLYDNDSIIISEYQEALGRYMNINPKAADEFMKLIEKQNEN